MDKRLDRAKKIKLRNQLIVSTICVGAIVLTILYIGYKYLT